MSKKNTGSYYTPSYLADFITTRVLTHFEGQKRVSVLEPSVGNGIFLEAIKKNQSIINYSIKVTALDINGNELTKAKDSWGDNASSFIESDFLDYSPQNKFSLVIGNPPYIKRNRLSPSQLDKCRELHSSENLSEVSVKNIWPAFVIKATTLLKDEGILAFILPLDLLQLKFTEEIREYLQTKYQRLDIFTFSNLVFECKGQDTLILIAYKKATRKGVFYAHIENESQLTKNKFTLKQNKALVGSKIKWTHHLLSSEEIKFIEGLKDKLNCIEHYCVSKAGIVTAANDYFIVDKETEDKYKLGRYTKPIIKKGSYINGSVVFDKDDYSELVNSNFPTRLIVFKDEDEKIFSKTIKTYLNVGETLGLPARYKCIQRSNWFVVPNISQQPEGFFFKRCHLYPKLLKNAANVFVTDSAYRIDMKKGFDIDSLVFSFYNSLTLAFAEIEGRYYGGGVLELTPNEFKKLPIPFFNVTSEMFQHFQKDFKSKPDMEMILEANDSKILTTVLGLSNEEIIKIQALRRMFMTKRLKSGSGNNGKK
jgi:adenine-specific DNA-methyltransferase